MVSYRDAVLADSPLGYWRLYEEDAAFASPNEVTATPAPAVRAGPTRTTAYTSPVLSKPVRYWDGVDDMYEVAAADAVPFAYSGGNLTVEFWLRPVNSGVDTYVSMREGNGTQEHFSVFYLDATSGVCFDLGGWRWKTTYVPPVDTWAHVAVTYESATTSRRLYVNGAQHSAWTPNTALALPTKTDVPVRFGVLGGNTNSWHKGSLAEVAIYNATLTAARLTAHYDARANPESTTADGLWLSDGRRAPVYLSDGRKPGLYLGDGRRLS